MPLHQTSRTFGQRRVPTLTSASGCWQLGEVTQARRDYIWPRLDLFFDDVVLLLQDSVDDLSLSSQTINATGTAGTSTAEIRFGEASFSSNGSQNLFSVSNDASLAMPGDFTIESWIYFDSYAANESFPVWRPVNHSFGSRLQFLVVNDKLYADIFGSVLLISNTLSLSAGQWYHVAASRSSGTMRLFLDGNVEASGSVGTSFLSDQFWLPYSFTTARQMYFDFFRVTLAGRYTANFTPPTV